MSELDRLLEWLRLPLRLLHQEEVVWLAHYEVAADDGQGPWELLSPHVPNTIGWKELRRLHGDRLKYKGLYAVGHLQRRRESQVMFKEPISQK